MRRFFNIRKNFIYTYFLGDSAYDCDDNYKYLIKDCNIVPIICSNPRNSSALPQPSGFTSDGAMDNYSTYALLKHYNILPFISLDSRTKAKFKYPHPDILCCDDKGNPICMGGIPFANWDIPNQKESNIVVGLQLKA